MKKKYADPCATNISTYKGVPTIFDGTCPDIVVTVEKDKRNWSLDAKPQY